MGSMTLVRRYALEQKERGASMLDINMGLSGINEKEMMLEAIRNIVKIVDLPLCIDTVHPETVEAALRLYPGRALLNSISAESERIEKVLPVAARYGAMFVLLPITDFGIPESCGERKEVVKFVLGESEKHGFSKSDIVLDGLVMTISAGQDAAVKTLELMEWGAKHLGVATVCGLSNVSFGLPAREWINAAFLSMCIERGLSAVIANPAHEVLMNIAGASEALTGNDKGAARYIAAFGKPAGSKGEGSKTPQNSAEEAYFCVLHGNDEAIEMFLKRALQDGFKASDLMHKYLVPAINEVGARFDRKEYFLPQLILSADTMRKGFDVLEPFLLKDSASRAKLGIIVIATVQGDIHDIGKNIVALMLKNYNFSVVDLGKDVCAEDIIRAAKQYKADIVGLSALMTTTMVEMKKVIQLARVEGLNSLRFMIGGAVVDKKYGEEIGADGYAANALEAVRLAKKMLTSAKPVEKTASTFEP